MAKINKINPKCLGTCTGHFTAVLLEQIPSNARVICLYYELELIFDNICMHSSYYCIFTMTLNANTYNLSTSIVSMYMYNMTYKHITVIKRSLITQYSTFIDCDLIQQYNFSNYYFKYTQSITYSY